MYVNVNINICCLIFSFLLMIYVGLGSSTLTYITWGHGFFWYFCSSMLLLTEAWAHSTGSKIHVDWLNGKDYGYRKWWDKNSKVPTQAEFSKDEMVTCLERDLTEDWENETVGRWLFPTLCWDRSFKTEMDDFEWWREIFCYAKILYFPMHNTYPIFLPKLSRRVFCFTF